MLAIMAITGHKQNASGSDLACLLGLQLSLSGTDNRQRETQFYQNALSVFASESHQCWQETAKMKHSFIKTHDQHLPLSFTGASNRNCENDQNASLTMNSEMQLHQTVWLKMVSKSHRCREWMRWVKNEKLFHYQNGWLKPLSDICAEKKKDRQF